MVGWHHQLNGHKCEQAPGVDDGQEGLACCSPWGRKESNTTEQLNWTELNSENKAKLKGKSSASRSFSSRRLWFYNIQMLQAGPLFHSSNIVSMKPYYHTDLCYSSLIVIYQLADISVIEYKEMDNNWKYKTFLPVFQSHIIIELLCQLWQLQITCKYLN